MNSEELRKISQEQHNASTQLEKDKRVSQYENYLQEIKHFVAENQELFLKYLNDQILYEVSKGKLTCTIYRTEYENQRITAFGSLSAPKFIWEKFFEPKNNPYLSEWAGQNQIYLTIKKRKKRDFDFLDWIDDFVFYLVHPTYSKYVDKSDIVNQFQWTIFIDARKHSRVYKLLRSLLYRHTYYHYSLRHGSKRYKTMKNEGRKVGFKE